MIVIWKQYNYYFYAITVSYSLGLHAPSESVKDPTHNYFYSLRALKPKLCVFG